MAEVVGKCKGPTDLDLSSNRIGSEGLGRLEGVLVECTWLMAYSEDQDIDSAPEEEEDGDKDNGEGDIAEDANVA